MRPVSIQTFDKALFASLAVTIVGTAINWSSFAAIADDPRTRAIGLGHGFVIASVLFNLGIYLLLWFFIARRASTVAKWLYVVLVAVSLLMFAQALAGPAVFGLVQILGALALALQVYAAWLLFRPDAAAWFDSGGDDPEPRGPVS